MSISLLNVVVDVNNSMRLNLRKCKTMTVDFLHYNSYVPCPIAVVGSDIDDLTWAVQCDYIVKKANRWLYALTQIRKSKVSSADIVHIY